MSVRLDDQTRDPAASPDAPRARLSPRAKLAVLRRPHTGQVAIRDTYGPVATLSLGPLGSGPRLVFVTSPRGARDVLGGTSNGIDKGLVHQHLAQVNGPSSFTMPHEQWQARRRVLQPIFTKKHVAMFADHMFDAASDMAAQWTLTGKAELNGDARRLTLRVLGRSLFGYDLGERADDLAGPVRQTMDTVRRRVTSPVRLPMWLPLPAHLAHRRALATIHAVIDEAIDRVHRGASGSAELIHQLVAAQDPHTGGRLTDAEIRDELMTFLVAGHDTTATTLAYAWWVLGRRPDLQERVAAEARAVGPHPLSAADVPALPYTRQVLHEALRLCPPAPVVARQAQQDVVVDGYRLRAGTQILVGIYALHHDPKLWGDDVEEFDPDRFSPERSADRDRWTYLPFGAGPRSCSGVHFALLEATIAVATLARAVEIESVSPGFRTEMPFTMVADGPIPARIRKQPRDGEGVLS